MMKWNSGMMECWNTGDCGSTLRIPVFYRSTTPTFRSVMLSSFLLLALVWPALAVAAATGPVRVTDASPSQRGRDAHGAAAAADKSDATPEDSVTEHTMLVQGHPIHYRATAGFLPIQRDSGQPIAHIFFVAYERLDGSSRTDDRGQTTEDGPQDATSSSVVRSPLSVLRNRPLMFAFNGGPGASAVWLHTGSFGPKRAVLANDGTTLSPADQLLDNEQTWLEFTDLVFVNQTP